MDESNKLSIKEKRVPRIFRIHRKVSAMVNFLFSRPPNRDERKDPIVFDWNDLPILKGHALSRTIFLIVTLRT